MQIGLRRTIVLALTAPLIAGSALAAAPRRGALYTGTGAVFMNNARRWTKDARGLISFRTSSSGRAVLGFKGGYSFYCGAGTATVTEKRMSVSPDGTFAAKFSVRTTGTDGKANGRAYVSIAGAFKDAGAKASVSYLVDYVFTGHHVKHPYDRSHPRRLGCASLVKGTVKAH